MTTARAELGLKSTMIGSLPHHNIDAALAVSFQVDVPFLPQIPIRNPWEFMIAQVLEGLPGLMVEKEGTVVLDTDVWTGRSSTLNERLLQAFSSMGARQDAFEAFEPSAATSSSWHPFLWELEERAVGTAKIQIAGPLTAQWALTLKDGSNINQHTDISSQIYRLVLARALAMSRRLQRGGIQPVLYLDEPGLYGFNAADPRGALALQELRILVQALRKEGVLVGVHCCSDTDWASVLSLGLDILSIDTGLSLASLLKHGALLEKFLTDGSRLSLGVIPTSRLSESGAAALDVKIIFAELLETFGEAWGKRPELVRKTLSTALFTPACGLALHSIADAEASLAALLEFTAFCRQSLS